MSQQTEVIDQHIRQELLISEQSFIVQAPAGSGKTELLTQRILALLSVVEKPENILAITFTRKAAVEMRTRVLSALQLAQQEEPQAEHEKQRWRLARKALERDREKNWKLSENPARLNITTIDSLSASLSGALPLLSQTGTLPKIADNADAFYQEAADNLLLSVSDKDQVAQHIQCLLKHKDNNLNQVSSLLAQMLSRRLQWLAPIASHARQQDDEQMVHSLRTITSEKLQQLYKCLPNNIVSELPELLNQAAEVLNARGDTNKPYLTRLTDIGAIAKPTADELPLWKGIAELLLKSGDKGEFLSSFTVRQGFPVAKDGVNAGQQQQYKQNKKQVVEIAKELASIDGMGDLFLQVKILPDIEDRSLSHQALKAAVALLPVAVAHLKLVFSKYNQIDFSELSLASLQALGHADMPSDLALTMDYKLEHILIDEFQDTSTPQVELIKLLTAGWEPGAGRSLFLVGDPMQSIYRFRDANVSLFMQICHNGIGDIKLAFRQLQVNFRSSKKIVDWVNAQFSRIMPDKDDPTYSAVSYAPSVAFHASSDESQITPLISLGAEDHYSQAEKIIALVKEHLQANQGLKNKKRLALLASSRNHLREIIELLNQNSIVFEAVEIDRLSQKIVVSDLCSLAYALCDSYDELSWVACMRSPWFGLSLEDIRNLLTATDKNLALPQRIQQAQPLMTPDSQRRCEKILPLLNSAIKLKAKKPFRKWLYGCFKAVGGLSLLDLAADLDDLMVCLGKLDELSEGGELYDRQVIADAIDRLYAAPDPDADGQVQVMTIHKSKGLEFDTVILPRLDARKRSGDDALLKWTEILDESGEAHNLLAISRQAGKDNEPLYQYINYLDKQKAKFEEQRLLYVAATRAKEKLFLLGDVAADDKAESGYKAAGGNTFLAMLWSGIEGDAKIYQPLNLSGKVGSENGQESYSSRFIKTSNLDKASVIPVDQNTQENVIPESNNLFSAELEGGWPDGVRPDGISPASEQEYCPLAAAMGSVLHAQLQWLSEKYTADFVLPENWDELTQRQLTQQGIFSNQDELEKATEKVIAAVTNTLADPFGKLVLSADEGAASELVLHKKIEGGDFLTRIIDRTFVYQGKRWIVDYKSSQPEKGESVEQFLVRETGRYYEQIHDYYHLFARQEKRPIIAGLYFPMLAHFEKMFDSCLAE